MADIPCIDEETVRRFSATSNVKVNTPQQQPVGIDSSSSLLKVESQANRSAASQPRQAVVNTQISSSHQHNDFSYPTTFVHVVNMQSRGPSPVLLAPAHFSVPAPPTARLLPSPMYAAASHDYDPNYVQYLGQAADGYQYELVRRPSMGATPAPILTRAQMTVQASSGQQDFFMPNYNLCGGGSSLLIPTPSPVPNYHPRGANLHARLL
jgi:hypothetical protein